MVKPVIEGLIAGAIMAAVMIVIAGAFAFLAAWLRFHYGFSAVLALLFGVLTVAGAIQYVNWDRQQEKAKAAAESPTHDQ